MTTLYFNVKTGLTTGNIKLDAASGNITGVGNAALGNLATANYFSGNGYYLSGIYGGNVIGQVGNALIAGTVYSSSQPNITSVGTLSSLTVTGNVSSGNVVATNNVSGATLTGTLTTQAQPNITSVGTLSSVTVSGNVSAGNVNITSALYVPTIYGNVVGNISGNLAVPGVNKDVIFNDSGAAGASTSFQFDKLTSVLTLSGNLTTNNANLGNLAVSNYFQGDGSLLTNITGGNVTGQVANALVAGTVYNPAQGNITSVGTMQSITMASGTSISGGNLLSATYITGTLTTQAQPNITSLGTLTALGVNGNLNITGNINVTGNLNYSNVTDLVIGDPLIYLGANNTGNIWDLGIVGSYNDGTYYHTGLARNAATGIWTVFDRVVAEPTTVIDWANATIGAFKVGNLTAGNVAGGNLVSANYISGNGSLLTSLTGGNVTGQVGNALVAGTVYTAAQPNITSTGTLNGITVTGTANFVGASNVSLGPVANVHISGGTNGYLLQTNGSGTLSWVAPPSTSNIANGTSNVNIATSGGNVTTSVGGTSNVVVVTSTGVNVAGYMNATGNITSGNASLGNLASASYFSGDGGLLSNIAGGNVTGQVANALVAGTVYSNAQPNITSVGTLTSLSVSGNITAGNLVSSGSGGNISGADYVIANYFQGNGSSLSGLNASNLVSGTISSGILGNSTLYIGTTSIALNRSSGAQSLTGITSIDGYAATVSTNAQPNITSVGTLTSLAVTGNATVGNAVITGGILSNRANVSVTTNTVIDEFAPATYRSAKYVLSASGTNGYQSAEILLVQDGTNSYITIYGSVCSNSSADIVDFSSNINGISGNVTVYATASGASTKVNLVATYLKT